MHMQWYISSDREVHQLQVSNGKWHLFEVIRHDSSVNHHQIRIVYFLTLYKVLLYSIQYQPCKVQSTHVHDRGILFQLTKHFWHLSWLTKCDMVPQAQVIWGNVTSMMANTGEIYQVCCWCIYEFCLGPNFILIVPYLVTNGGTIITIAYTLAERGPMLCTAEMSPSITASKLKYLPATDWPPVEEYTYWCSGITNCLTRWHTVNQWYVKLHYWACNSWVTDFQQATMRGQK